MKRIMDAAFNVPWWSWRESNPHPLASVVEPKGKRGNRLQDQDLFPRRLVPFTRIAFTCEFQRPNLVMAAHTAAVLLTGR